jgi:arylsulfatase A-like enzyme
MKFLKISILIVLTYLNSSYAQNIETKRPEKPNVVLLLIDDLGWQDVKCYDIDAPSPFETPNIDKLAKDGVLFWQAYSPAPTCSPTRGAILSGKHPARLQRTHVVGGYPPLPDNESSSTLITPWFSGRLATKEKIIPETLKENGYYTGHIGKWHIAVEHNASPTAIEHGFDLSQSDRGVTKNTPNRLGSEQFATNDLNDPYRLDENGFPKDQNNINALNFLKKANSDKPFFLYYASWLVHAPIHTRSKALLEKYCKKMNVPYPTDPEKWMVEGQKNPYYAAMVEMMDYYIGQIINHLKTTDDARWPGHKLIENTYLIFTSDNGGMEQIPGEIITDNYPLDKGKINAKEGGIRVPLIISGPRIKAGQQSNVIASGLDFYPTILSWTNSKADKNQVFDGADLSKLLSQNPQDPNLILNQSGNLRNSIIEHFPHAAGMHSTLRLGDFKLIKNYDPRKTPLELFQLYDGGLKRKDIEEMKNLASEMPSKTKEMNLRLEKELKNMEASFPYYNPYSKFEIKNINGIPEPLTFTQEGEQLLMSFKENGNKVIKADLIYTLNGGQKYEEWYRVEATVNNGRVIAALPKGTTHFVFNLIDDHNFLVSYPRLGSPAQYKKLSYSANAFKVK